MIGMKKRRELTSSEQADAVRLKSIYIKAKLDRKAEGRNLTYEVVAASLDVTSGAVSQYVNGTTPLNLPIAAKFAKFFGLPLKNISPSLALLLPNATVPPSKNGSQPNSVPLLSWVQAGDWQEIEDLHTIGCAEKWIPCPVPHSANTFALTVRGRSMYNPGEKRSFDDGDIIHVDGDSPAEHRSLVVVRLTDQNDAIFKQLLVEGEKHFLEALNPSWPNRIVEMPRDAVICGVVISKVVSFP